MTFKIYTLGCKVNQYDSARLAVKLRAAGFCMAETGADLAIINTCAVTKTAIRKDRQAVNKARSENSGAKIIVMGCWPKAYEEDSLPGVEIARDGKQLDDLISKAKDSKLKVRSQSKNRESIFTGEKETYQPAFDRSRYFIKIQDGCEQFCSYCVIPYARGGLKSRPEKEILDEIGAAAKEFGEIILCGIHLGLYGKDFEKMESAIKGHAGRPSGNGTGKKKAADLTGLLKKILKIDKLGRIRLSSIEITEVSDELIGLMAAEKKLCRHLHIPLQSGSDKILRLMNRPYDAGYFRERVKKIRKALPEIALTADVITGFPGETEVDFIDTFNFIKETRFSRLHVFPFSAHEKTPAAKMPGAVSDKVKRLRAERLKMLGKKLSREYEKKFIGRELCVAVEGGRNGSRLAGKTEYYFDILFDRSRIAGTCGKNRIGSGGDLKGKLVRVRPGYDIST